jgi:large subunit ribosomal protein L30
MQEQTVPAAGGRRLKITLIKSVIGYRESQRLTVKSLGLRRIRQSVIHYDSPSIQGMIQKVGHLVSVEEVGADEPETRRQTGSQRFQARLEKRAAEREAIMAALAMLDDEDDAAADAPATGAAGGEEWG